MRIFRTITAWLLVCTFFTSGFSQENPKEAAAPDSVSGTFNKVVTDFGNHAPELNWYLILVDFLWIILILLLGYIISRYLLQPLRIIASRKQKDAVFLTRLIFSAQILIWVMVLYIILFKVIRVSPVTEAIIGATLGLSLIIAGYELLLNLIAGIRIALTKIPKEGDYLEFDHIDGIVEKTGLITTIIGHDLNMKSIIPNRRFLQNPLQKLIAAEHHLTVQVDFYFPVDGDFVKVQEIAERAASLSKYVYLNDPIAVDLENVFREGKSLICMHLSASIISPELRQAFRTEVSGQILSEVFRQQLFTSDQMNF